MTIADGSLHSLHYIAESTYGTTPSTPTWTPLPHTATTLGLEKETIESEKLRGDRFVEDVRHGNKSIGGDVSGELEYGAFDDMLEAVLGGTWSTNVLKVGSTRRSFTFERKFSDIATPEWHRYTGCEVNTLSMSVAPNAMVGVTLGVIGQDTNLATAEVASSTYSADVGNLPFDSFTGSITEGGSSIAVVTSLELTLENGLESKFAVGSAITNRPSIGKSRVSGNLTAYFESKTLYEKFVNETASDIVFVLTDPDGNDLTIDITNVKYTSGRVDVSGPGSVTVPMDFIGLYSSGDASNLVITRAPA